MMFKPFVASEKKVAEFTLRAVILGIVLGLIFGVGNAYLGLKVGTTVSASIPAAVISMTILRAFFREPTILENNLVQTMASVGEGLAAGVIFTVPALFILGEPPSMSRLFLLSALGGILGVLFMIPMRRYIIVKEHGILPFPEGTACAEILKSGAGSLSKAVMAMLGIVTGAVYKICCGALNLWKEAPSWIIAPFQKTEFSIDATPALLGVGYIIGPRISAYLLAGGALGWWVLIPLIKMFDLSSALIYPGAVPVAQMTADDIWSNYIRYIGAGCVAIGGILSLINIAPLIWKTFHSSISELFERGSKRLARVDKDISLKWLIVGSAAIILTLWLFPGMPMNLLTILLLVVLGFFFVAVTSLTVGIVGSTSNPVSGMTITTLLLTCLIFVGLGWTERLYLIAALTMSIVACVAICMAGTTSQDLKTGYILGATPRWQQVGEIIGVFLPAFAISGVLYLLHQVYGFGTPALPAPQGTMMALIAQGVMAGDIPFTLVFVGIVIGLLLRLLSIPILPVALGVYLPLSLSTPVFIGGLVATYVRHKNRNPDIYQRGVLASSGLVAGDACTGVVIALLSVAGWLKGEATPYLPDWVSLLVFLALAVALAKFTLRPPKLLKIE
jgi:putative OPT family oligopeptide transporter